MKHSTAQILAELLRTNASVPFFTKPMDNDDWPLYISSMPDGDGVENTCGTVYDTAGVKKARLMDGTEIFSLGFQLKIRSLDYEEGWQKAQAVALHMSSVHNEEVAVGEETYEIDCISLSAFVLSLGQDEKKRCLFSINGLVMVKQL